MSMNNERINRIVASELQTGAKVVSSDDELLGSISAVEGGPGSAASQGTRRTYPCDAYYLVKTRAEYL